MRARGLIIAVVCAVGLGTLPAFGAPLAVSSGAITTFRACVLTPVTAGSSAAFDVSVDQSAPTQNQGMVTTLTVRSHSNRNVRAYVRFDLTRCSPTIPSSATITSAMLRMVPTAVANQCRTYDVFRVGASWVETTATWNNQPFGTAINNPSSASRTSFVNVGVAPCQNSAINQYVSGWDVTADVRAFATGTTDHGWMIRDDVEGSAAARTTTFIAKETGIGTPQLIVSYST